jgi:hypothetical protein
MGIKLAEDKRNLGEVKWNRNSSGWLRPERREGSDLDWRYLKIGIGTAQQEANPTRVIDQIGKVGEPFILLSPIVNGAGTAGRILDAQIVLSVAA